jgi:uncharacterized protein (TIGR03000 family)
VIFLGLLEETSPLGTILVTGNCRQSGGVPLFLSTCHYDRYNRHKNPIHPIHHLPLRTQKARSLLEVPENPAILISWWCGGSTQAGFGNSGKRRMSFMVRNTMLAVALSLGMSIASVQGGWGSMGAGWGSYGGGYGGSSGYGSSGGYGSCGGYTAGYGSSGNVGASHGHVGPVRALLHHLHDKIHHHHAARYAYRSHGYGSSGYGSSGYGSTGYGSSGYRSSVASYGSSGGSSGGYQYGHFGSSGGGSSGGVSYESGYGSSGSSWSAPSDGVIYEGSSGSMAPIITPTTSVEPDAIHLYVQVPESAKVFINGKATSSTGATRHYVSRGVEAGSSYRFEIRAEVGEGEQKQVEERSLVIAGGRRESVQIAFREATRKLETKVTLRVPAEAKVTLAGNSTESHGELRTFTTANLKEGMVWDDYTVEVTHQGQTKKQQLRLVAGDQLELAFQFEDSDSRLASK